MAIALGNVIAALGPIIGAPAARAPRAPVPAGESVEEGRRDARVASQAPWVVATHLSVRAHCVCVLIVCGCG